MKFKFEKLQVWQRSMDFGEGVCTIIKQFPEYKKLYDS